MLFSKITCITLVCFSLSLIKQGSTQQLPPLNGKSGDYFGTIRVYFGPSKKSTQFMAHDDSINQIKVFNAGGLAASASNDNTVRIWNLSTMNLLLTYNGHTDDVQCVEFIDGKTIASGSVDMSLQIWQVKDGKMLKKIKFTTWVTSLLLLQSGLLASGDFLGKIRMWNVTTGNNVFSLANPQGGAINSMITVGNSQMASGANDYKGVVWSLQTKSRLYTLNGHKFAVSSLELVNATVLATGSADNTVKLWKITGKELNGTIIRTLSGHSDSVTSLDMYDANTLMSGSHDQSFRFWNWNTGACVKTIDTGLYINTFVVF